MEGEEAGSAPGGGLEQGWASRSALCQAWYGYGLTGSLYVLISQVKRLVQKE